MSAKSGKPVSVWFSSVAAYIIVTAVSVLLGAVFSKFVKPEIIRYIGASLFVVIGLLMFSGKL